MTSVMMVNFLGSVSWMGEAWESALGSRHGTSGGACPGSPEGDGRDGSVLAQNHFWWTSPSTHLQPMRIGETPVSYLCLPFPTPGNRSLKCLWNVKWNVHRPTLHDNFSLLQGQKWGGYFLGALFSGIPHCRSGHVQPVIVAQSQFLQLHSQPVAPWKKPRGSLARPMRSCWTTVPVHVTWHFKLWNLFYRCEYPSKVERIYSCIQCSSSSARHSQFLNGTLNTVHVIPSLVLS